MVIGKSGLLQNCKSPYPIEDLGGLDNKVFTQSLENRVENRFSRIYFSKNWNLFFQGLCFGQCQKDFRYSLMVYLE